jgi:hypothetical protein
MKKTLFAIYIVEEDDTITIQTEYIGKGELALSLGLEVYYNLRLSATINDQIDVKSMRGSEYFQ